jgi:hypothetical protein
MADARTGEVEMALVTLLSPDVIRGKRNILPMLIHFNGNEIYM